MHIFYATIMLPGRKTRKPKFERRVRSLLSFDCRSIYLCVGLFPLGNLKWFAKVD